MTQYPQELFERFLSKALVQENGCHDWQSTLHRDGYGKFWFINGQIPSHRMAYRLHKGEIPKGLWVLHTCDNRKCVNPDHLYLGTPKQNTKDRDERCPRWSHMKVTLKEVEEIRDLYASGRFSQTDLAAFYGIDQTQVSRIILRKQRTYK